MSDTPSLSVSMDAAQESPSFLQKLRNNLALIGVGAWAVAGIAALIMSIVWFGFNGTLSEKLAGLAIAFFLGPLYFAVCAINKEWARNLGANATGLVNRMRGGAKVVSAAAAVSEAAATVAEAVSA